MMMRWLVCAMCLQCLTICWNDEHLFVAWHQYQHRLVRRFSDDMIWYGLWCMRYICLIISKHASIHSLCKSLVCELFGCCDCWWSVLSVFVGSCASCMSCVVCLLSVVCAVVITSNNAILKCMQVSSLQVHYRYTLLNYSISNLLCWWIHVTLIPLTGTDSLTDNRQCAAVDLSAIAWHGMILKPIRVCAILGIVEYSL